MVLIIKSCTDELIQSTLKVNNFYTISDKSTRPQHAQPVLSALNIPDWARQLFWHTMADAGAVAGCHLHWLALWPSARAVYIAGGDEVKAPGSQNEVSAVCMLLAVSAGPFCCRYEWRALGVRWSISWFERCWMYFRCGVWNVNADSSWIATYSVYLACAFKHRALYVSLRVDCWQWFYKLSLKKRLKDQYFFFVVDLYDNCIHVQCN